MSTGLRPKSKQNRDTEMNETNKNNTNENKQTVRGDNENKFGNFTIPRIKLVHIPQPP